MFWMITITEGTPLINHVHCCRVSETTGTGRGRRRRDGAAGAPQVKERTRQGQERGRGLWKDVRYITD